MEKEKEIKVRYHSEWINKIEKINVGDWIDLRSAEELELLPGEFRLISLGISMKLPDGYEAHIVPRSSTFKNFGIIQTNSIGIIDNSYSGDNDIWKMPVLCVSPEGSKISINDRICQFRIVKKQPEIQFTEVTHLDGPNRGGFGSTGKN